jgi:transcription elongation factor GreA
MEFITPDDKKRLQAQLAELVGRRKGLSDRIGRARELGDLRENAEYHAAKEDQGFNELKIRQLEERLANSAVADPDEVPDGVVFVGSTVRLRDVDKGSEDLFRVVGETSGDFSDDYVEVTQGSPMGQALMRARVGEVVRVDLPRGEKRFEVVEIT